MKTCTRCKTVRPLDQFSKMASQKDGLHYTCKTCTQSLNRSYRERNREKLRAKRHAEYQADRDGHLAKGKAWKAANRERHQYLQRRSHLKNTYGITPEQYDQLLADQGGACAICEQPAKGRRLHVDHDHFCCPGKRSCGKCLRGLLCAACNVKLGWLENRWPAIARYTTTRLEKSA